MCKQLLSVWQGLLKSLVWLKPCLWLLHVPRACAGTGDQLLGRDMLHHGRVNASMRLLGRIPETPTFPFPIASILPVYNWNLQKKDFGTDIYIYTHQEHTGIYIYCKLLSLPNKTMEHGVTQVVEILINLKSVEGLYKEVLIVTEREERDL